MTIITIHAKKLHVWIYKNMKKEFENNRSRTIYSILEFDKK